MRIGIIAAMEEEIKALREMLVKRTVESSGHFEFFKGELMGHEVILLLCGIGKVNAAVGTTLLIERYAPQGIINTGVAGGFPPDLIRLGDIVIATEARHHDADATVFDYEYGQIPRMPAAYETDPYLRERALENIPETLTVRVHTGQILSGDSFVHARQQIRSIRERFPSILAVEMEGAAIAQTCYLFSTPFLLIRSISDLVMEQESKHIYELSVEASAENSVQLVLSLLKALHEEASPSFAI